MVVEDHGTVVVAEEGIVEGRGHLFPTESEEVEVDRTTQPILQAEMQPHSTPRGTQLFSEQLQARSLQAITQAAVSST